MTARLHDLVQSLLVRYAEKYADAALFGSSSNISKGAFRAVCKIHSHMSELLYKAVLDDIAEYTRVLSDPFRRFENCLYRDFLQAPGRFC